MDEISSAEYKKILLETMDVFDSFCRENNLKYFLISGSLLGAVRHKGFIPWDDDIDVGMPMEDYVRFAKLFKNSEKYKYIDCYNNSEYYLPYAKLCNYDVDLHEKINSKLHIGAYIDIFPFSYLKEDKKLLKHYYLPNKFIKLLRIYKYSYFSKERGFIKNIILFVLRLIYPFSLNKIARKKNEEANKICSPHKTSLIGHLFGSFEMNCIFNSSVFANLIELDFEGRKYFCPSEYDVFLSQVFGDYMTLPPEEERVTHHGFDAFLKK